MPGTELYIGNLNRDATRRDIEGLFEKYGRVVRCDVKDKGFGTIYAFLEFEDARDAEDALLGENGKDMRGNSMVVEYAQGKDRPRSDRGRFGGDRRDNGYGGSRGGPPQRGGFRGGFNGGGRPPLECYECGERGHFARDCTKRRGGPPRDSRDRRDDRREPRRDDYRRDSRRDSRHRSRSHSRPRSRSPSYGR